MKQLRAYVGLLLSMIGLVIACNKDSAVKPAVEGKAVTGTVTMSNDTATVVVEDLIIKFRATQPCYPETEMFTFWLASTPANKATYNWSFGDGYTATGSWSQHQYDLTANYTAVLNIKDSNNVLVRVISFPVKAWGKQIKPEAIFSYKNDFQDDINYVTFNSASSLNKGAIVNYFWDWGDGKTENSAVGLIRHQFPKVISDQTYTVKLTITTNAGCTAQTSGLITIPGAYPITGTFSAIAYEACTNEHFIFTAEATSVPTGSVYHWHFSDGTGDVSGYSVAHTFKYMNDYDVILYITLNDREIYRTHKVVNAKGENPKPVASFYTTLVNTTASTVKWSFNSQSTVAHGAISGYNWDFGDGQTNNDYYNFIENTYTRSTNYATFKVRLIAAANGCFDTAYQYVSVPAK